MQLLAAAFFLFSLSLSTHSRDFPEKKTSFSRRAHFTDANGAEIGLSRRFFNSLENIIDLLDE
jgi:hypothetical protein